MLAWPGRGGAQVFTPPPDAPGATDVIGVRYRAFGLAARSRAKVRQIYLGTPNLAPRSNPRAAYNWATSASGSVSHPVAFTWDPVNDKLITVVVPADAARRRRRGRSTATTLEFTAVRDAVAQEFGLSVDALNVLSVVIKSETPDTTIALNDITFNGQLLGSLDARGFNRFDAYGLDFTKGFTVTATLVLTGAFQGNANDPYVEILGAIAGCTADADCDDGLACNGAETCDPATLSCIPGTPVECTGVCDTGVCIDPDGFCEQIPGCPTTTTTTSTTSTTTSSSTTTTTTTSTSTTTSLPATTTTTGPGTTSTMTSSTTTTTTSTTTTSSTSTTTSSTTTTSTTATTLPPIDPCAGACGNGVVDGACGEVCDGADLGGASGPADRPVGAPVCTPACRRIDYTPCMPASPAEICGNCFDDDANGLTDFEDPACCPSAFQRTQRSQTMLTCGRLVPGESSTTVNLGGALDAVTDQLPFDVTEFYVQLRVPGGDELLCARIPAGNFVPVARGFDFRDPKGSVETARGIDQINARTRRGATQMGTFGKRVQFVVPSPGPIDVTLAIFSRTAVAANGACATTRVDLVAGRGDRLVYPDDAAARMCRRPSGSKRSTCQPTRRNRAVAIPLADHR
jgi:hypothetical protein